MFPDTSWLLQQPVEVLDKSQGATHHQQAFCAGIQAMCDEQGLLALQRLQPALPSAHNHGPAQLSYGSDKNACRFASQCLCPMVHGRHEQCSHSSMLTCVMEQHWLASCHKAMLIHLLNEHWREPYSHDFNAPPAHGTSTSD